MSDAQQKAASAISEVSADWVVRLSAPDVSDADRMAFMEWLRQSPVHVAEYLSAEAVFQAMQGAARNDSSNVAELLQQARTNIVGLPNKERANEGDSTTLIGIYRAAHTARVWRLRRPAKSAAAAAIVMLTAGIMFMLGRELHDPNVYATNTGEQRRIILADGSAIDLNTRSSIRVEFTDLTRDIYLTEGEAFFAVAKDPARPFRVASGAAVVRAVGTQFNVYRQASQTVVTVLEGRVAVTEAASLDLEATEGSRPDDRSGNSPVVRLPIRELVAGQEIAVAARREADVRTTAQPVSANARAAVAWRQRRLIFEDEALADVVAEFNRYNRRQLVIEDAKLAGERISGVFDADKPEDLTAFLTRNGEVHASEAHESRIVLTLSQ